MPIVCFPPRPLSDQLLQDITDPENACVLLGSIILAAVIICGVFKLHARMKAGVQVCTMDEDTLLRPPRGKGRLLGLFVVAVALAVGAAVVVDGYTTTRFPSRDVR